MTAWQAPDKGGMYATTGERPTLLSVISEQVPAALRARPNWVGWILHHDRKAGRLTKKPVGVNEVSLSRGYGSAKSDTRGTWAAWERAVHALLNPLNPGVFVPLQGLGFMFGPGKESDGFLGIDLDKCRQPDGGELSPQAQEIVAVLPGYWEVSPSGTGIKGFFAGQLPNDGSGKRAKLPDDQEVEVYDRGRFFCVTGRRIDGATVDVTPLPDTFGRLFSEWFPEKSRKELKAPKPSSPGCRAHARGSRPDDLLERMFSSKNGDKIRALWNGDTNAHGNDESRADLALCCHLAFWCGKDPAAMEDAFSRSALGQREKWRKRADYRDRTIQTAVETTTEVYTGGGFRSRGAHEPRGETTVASNGERFPDTDMANGARFGSDHRGHALYVADMKRWFVFDGTRWNEDETETQVLGLAQQTARRMADKAFEAITAAAALMRDAEGEDEEGRAKAALGRAKAEMSWAKQTQDMKRLSAMVKAARPGLMVPFGRDVFDRNPHLLPCANGTVDLRTGELRAHDRDDYLTKLCPTPYRSDAQAPTYVKFLNAVLGSPEEVEYVRRLSGYAVTGEVTAQVLHIFYGCGSNGKNVLLDLWLKVLGEIGVMAPPELVADKGESRHPTERTVVRGRRLAVCEETEDDERLNAKRVKQLTGGGNVVARGVYQNFFEFVPTHKLIVSTNALPEVRTNDHATWRRIRLVNFPRVFWTESDRLRDPNGVYPEHLRADPNLPDRLRTEAEGVLADMVRYAVAFYAAGRSLDAPPAVMRSVADYQQREDHIGRWLDLHTTAAPFDRDDPIHGVRGERGMIVYERFKNWFLREVDPDEKAVPAKRKFCVRLASRFKTRTLDGNEHYGLRLIAPPHTGKPTEHRGEEPFSGEVEN